MGRIALFIDGGYLNLTLRNEFGGARIDYEKLARWMAGESDLLRTYYYTCLPYKGSPPTQEESHRFAHAQRFVQSLERLSRFQVRLGRLAYRGRDAAGKPTFVQKRIDLQLGLDMALLAAKSQVTEVALVSGDSDLLPAVEVVKAEGVLVRLFHGIAQRPHVDLFTAADERIALTQQAIDNILLP